MSVRDDMVIRPTIGRDFKPRATLRARQEARLEREKGRHGVLRKIRAARRLRQARQAASLARGSLGNIRALRAAANPVGALVLGAVAAVAVGVRLATGQPYEDLGNKINSIFLGEWDEKARARMQTRQHLQSSEPLSFIYAQSMGKNEQIDKLRKDIEEFNFRAELGKTAIKEAYPVNSKLDMLILRAAELFKSSWAAAGIPELIESIKQPIQFIHALIPGTNMSNR